MVLHNVLSKDWYKIFILPLPQLAQPYIRKELGVFVALCKLFSVYFSYYYGIPTQLPCDSC